MKELGITKGVWEISKTKTDFTIRSKQFGISNLMGDYRGNIIADISHSLGVEPDIDQEWLERYNKGFGGRQHALSEVEANAKLIADAGTTANKCNLLPSELLQRYNEAIEALEQIKDLCKPSNQNEFAIKSIAEQTISKAKGE